jgi:Choline dehydrogenase and related flavoproteins
MNAKSSTLASMIPDAEKSGKCEIRPHSYVRRVEMNNAGHATGVTYFDANRGEIFQRAKSVVLCANGAETPRLLFMSESNRFPDGLANSSGYVGKNLMFNGGAFAGGVFEHEINGFKGVVDSRVIQDTYELDPKARPRRRRWFRLSSRPLTDRLRTRWTSLRRSKVGASVQANAA